MSFLTLNPADAHPNQTHYPPSAASDSIWGGGKGWCSVPVLRLGRQASLDVCVADPRVSRLHAEIELRGNQFVLVDHSSNGTFVTPEAGEEFQVSHGQMVLPRSGWLSLGTCAVTGATVLRFEQRLLTQVLKRPRMVG